MKYLYTIILIFWSCFIFSKASAQNTLPNKPEYINPKLAAKIKPALSEWLEFYDLDIMHFEKIQFSGIGIEEKESIPIRKWKHVPDTLIGGFVLEYDEENDNVYEPIFFDYSPNKKYYVGVATNYGVTQLEDGSWFAYGGDDCQSIYLTNRDDKWVKQILWFGASSLAEGAFWIDNDSFIIVIRNSYDNTFEFRIFGKLAGYYSNKVKELPKKYFCDYNLKKRGINTDF